MAGRITELVVDRRGPAGLAAWWAEVLGDAVLSTDDDGATGIGPPAQPEKGPVPTPWQVLADPAGNEFCLLRSRVAPVRG
jgi:uncharacterized protein YfaP (DUF2135 family)